MKVKITLFGGEIREIEEAVIDPIGIHFNKTSTIIIPGQEDELMMGVIPWAAISELEYAITPDMVTPDEDVAPRELNRAQRRAAK